MRVLHVDSGREYRGGQNQVRLLTRELARQADVQQRVITRRGSELSRRVTAAGVLVRDVPWTLGLDPRACWRIVVEALAWRPDIIHAHNSHAVTLAVWARGFLRYTGSPPRLVATRRVVFPVRRASALRRVDIVVAISEAVRATLLAARFGGRGEGRPLRSRSRRGASCGRGTVRPPVEARCRRPHAGGRERRGARARKGSGDVDPRGTRGSGDAPRPPLGDCRRRSEPQCARGRSAAARPRQSCPPARPRSAGGRA